jgi:ubiquinone/menaquinone biosynthesis C-methylase UbiE
MTMKLSVAIGSGGKVFAVDINPARLDLLRNHLQKLDFQNVTTITGLPENPRLPLNSLDAVLILDTYHEMKNHQEVLFNIKRSLKPGGRLVICDPIMEIRRGWSRPDLAAQHELEMSFALEDLRQAGFDTVFKKDRFIDREKIKGDKMWVVVAVKRRR